MISKWFHREICSKKLDLKNKMGKRDFFPSEVKEESFQKMLGFSITIFQLSLTGSSNWILTTSPMAPDSIMSLILMACGVYLNTWPTASITPLAAHVVTISSQSSKVTLQNQEWTLKKVCLQVISGRAHLHIYFGLTSRQIKTPIRCVFHSASEKERI